MAFAPTGDHRLALVGDWSVWRGVCLRGAGFPADLVRSLARPELAARIDDYLAANTHAIASMEALVHALRGDFASLPHEALVALRRARKRAERGKLPAAEDVAGVADDALRHAAATFEHRDERRRAVDESYPAARDATTRALRAAAADGRFREAVLSQNRAAVANGLDALLRSTPADEGKSQHRQHEELVASYLHRYCAKNDTIGFYGPVGWGTWSDDDAFLAIPGPSLLATSDWFFEQWGIDKVASVITAMNGVRPWLAPRRFGFVTLKDGVAGSPLTGPQPLSALEVAVLEACDGQTPARSLVIAGATADEIEATLRVLEQKKVIEWSLELPTHWRPDALLEERIARIGDAEVRARAAAPLASLRTALAAVVRASGAPEALGPALAGIDTAFHDITGASSTRNAGAMYASRTLVYQDARRDFDLRIGKRFRDDVTPALALVLESARWLTFAIAKEYITTLEALYARLAPDGGPTPLSELWFRAQRFVLGAKENRWEEPAKAACEAWTSLLAPEPGARRVQRASADLRAGVERAFAAPRAGWWAARHHSPDLMIAATDVEAIDRGDYLVVLGEIHIAMNTVLTNVFAAQHPEPVSLADGYTMDVPEPQIVPVAPKDSKLGGSRVSQSFYPAHMFDLDATLAPSARIAEQVVALADLVVVRESEGLVVRSVERGLAWPVFEVFAGLLVAKITNALDFLPRGTHRPRVTVDRLVIQRETWSIAPSTLEFLAATTELDVMIGVRAWAKGLGLPRFVFVKSPLEQKPIYVDLESPVSLRILNRILRHAKEHVGGEQAVSVSEMLPDLEHLWLTDAEGNRYTGELRIVAFDGRR